MSQSPSTATSNSLWDREAACSPRSLKTVSTSLQPVVERARVVSANVRCSKVVEKSSTLRRDISHVSKSRSISASDASARLRATSLSRCLSLSWALRNGSAPSSATRTWLPSSRSSRCSSRRESTWTSCRVHTRRSRFLHTAWTTTRTSTRTISATSMCQCGRNSTSSRSSARTTRRPSVHTLWPTTQTREISSPSPCVSPLRRSCRNRRLDSSRSARVSLHPTSSASNQATSA